MANEVRHTFTFWKPELINEYKRWWMPVGHDVYTEELSAHHDWPTHVRYNYPHPEHERRVRPIENAPDAPPDPHRPKKKRKITRSKGVFGSTQVIPEGHVRRVMKIRAFPTTPQRKVFQKWFSAARHTFNW
jgi:hypothetical protein